MPWVRRRYRGNKVWVETDAAEAYVLDERGLAHLRYKPDDDRTYSVRPKELAEVEDGPTPPAPPPPDRDPADPAAPAAIRMGPVRLPGTRNHVTSPQPTTNQPVRSARTACRCSKGANPIETPARPPRTTSAPTSVARRSGDQDTATPTTR